MFFKIKNSKRKLMIRADEIQAMHKRNFFFVVKTNFV